MSPGPTDPGFAIAATGLLAEARIAARCGRLRPVASGGSATRLVGLIEAAVAEGGRAIASFGVAGGLREDLRPGSCLIGSEVVHGGVVYRADATWTTRLARRVGAATLHRIAGADEVLSRPAEKRALSAASGAAAVDMESHVVADVAARHGLPFAVVRVIADPAGRSIPQAALAGMRPDGTTDVGACLRSLVRNPAEVPALAWVAVDTARAMLRLVRCVQLAGPGLGFFDRG
ncbi:MAG TPA: phosphorylase [Hyphomicrobiaceae bacterium]